MIQIGRLIGLRIPQVRKKVVMEIVEHVTGESRTDVGSAQAVLDSEREGKLAKLKEFEEKNRKRLSFDLDSAYFFSIVFESTKARDAFLKRHGLTLIHDDHIMFEDIRAAFVDEGR